VLQLETIGDRILNLRKKLDKTQKEICASIGITEVTLSRYENNIREPKGEIISKIATSLGTTTDYLLGRTDIQNEYKKNKTLDEQLQEVLNKLQDNNSALMFKGEAINDATKEALLISLKNTLDLAESMTKNQKK
jgi:transcriptional regulator with XRE-family HTH domain